MSACDGKMLARDLLEAVDANQENRVCAMSDLTVGVAGADVSPRFHPQLGAWGTSPTLTDLDLPLLARCVALRQDGRTVVWYSIDLITLNVSQTDELRAELAAALRLTPEQIVLSTSQVHSSGAFPGSNLTGCAFVNDAQRDDAFADAERKRFMALLVETGREALQQAQPARVFAGRGYCDSMSYNTRLPMPTGGNKFSRHHAEGLQSGKYHDPIISLVRFESKHGQPLGAIFNFCAHPATMINGRHISSDWVGTARAQVEAALDGAPVLYAQGFCGDVNCNHIFGTPEQARRSGMRLGTAAAEALATLIPVRAVPLYHCQRTIEVNCRPMYTLAEVEHALELRYAFVAELEHDPAARWFDGVNFPEPFSVEDCKAGVRIQTDYFEHAKAMLERGESGPGTLALTLGALRIGDVGAVLSPGEPFAAAARKLRQRSPFAHLLVCGDTNGVFGYMGDDAEIARRGYETQTFWNCLYVAGFRLPLAPGTAQQIEAATCRMLGDVRGK